MFDATDGAVIPVTTDTSVVRATILRRLDDPDTQEALARGAGVVDVGAVTLKARELALALPDGTTEPRVVAGHGHILFLWNHGGRLGFTLDISAGKLFFNLMTDTEDTTGSVGRQSESLPASVRALMRLFMDAAADETGGQASEYLSNAAGVS